MVRPFTAFYPEEHTMKRLLFIALILIPLESGAQSNVDKLVEQLDFLSSGSINNWKYSTDLSVDPTRLGFDDSQWKNLKLDERIYPDSCWIRKEIILPERILGQTIGGTMKFLVSVDDYGYMWIDGQSKGHFPWDGEFILTNNARPGQKVTVAIKAINTGGPLRLIRAQIQSEGSASLRRMIEDFSVGLRVGQKLLSFDTYQTNARVKVDPGIDKSMMDRTEKKRLNELLQSLATKVDVDALKNGNVEKFKSSITSISSQLKPVSEYAKRFTLYFDSNAHIDAAWLWRDKETIEVCKNTFASVFNMMDQRPDFTYTQSTAAYYDWMERLSPGIFKKIQERVKDGRWEVVGGMWVEPDCNLPSGESWARHLLYAKRYFRQKLGADVKIGWNPDSFGYNWNMPLFYSQAGIDAFITQKIGWNDTNVFPYRVFWWESPDGSRILSYFPFDYVNTIDDPYRLVDWLRQFESNTGFTKMLMLFGVGDHGGGPSLEMLDRIDRLKNLDIYPAIEHGTTTTYLDWLKRQNLSTVPVWDDELYLEYHQGTYTTQATMKKENRAAEVLLTNAEKFSSIATLFGRTYNSSDLETAWRSVLFNQFHDILPGSGIRENYIDANEKYDDAKTIGHHELDMALQTIAQRINTSSIKKGKPIVVFNPLGWERTDLVRISLPTSDNTEYAVFDLKGVEIPSQVISTSRYEREMLFIASDVPSVGYKVYELRKVSPKAGSTSLSISQTMLENSQFTISVDQESGWVKSIIDKRNDRELLSGPGNELQLLEDKPSAWDAWNIGLTGVKFPSTFRHAEVIEKGPVRVVLRLHRDYLKPGTKKDFPTEDFPSTFFTQDIVLYDGLDRIDFKTDVDWWEDKTMAKVAFPLTVQDTVATYEIPFGTIRRSTQMRDSWEKAKVEVPAQRWGDVSSGGYGVSLLNNSKYGYDIKGNVMRLSLLRSPKWPDPTADRGKHSIEYSLLPHTGSWQDAQTVRRGYEFNNPLIAVMTDPHKGSLAPTHSFIALSPASLVLSTLKKAEDSDDWIVQWYDASGRDSEARLQLPQKPKKVLTTNFLEEDGEPIQTNGNSVTVRTKKNSITTVKIYY
jgi:alpha-mannosidase